MDKTYVEFYYRGIFLSETSIREVPDRSIPKDIPTDAYGFRFFSRSEVGLDGELLQGNPRCCSGIYYYHGELLTLEDVKKLKRDTSILQQNMVCNKWDKVVLTRHGGFMPLFEKDVVITTSGEMI